MSTYRERRERRAERRRQWAASRTRAAESSMASATRLADQIPLGQPILVGHHSEAHARRDRDRIDNGIRNSIEHEKMAQRHLESATTIEAQLERSIYDDDPDAIERLEERIAVLEAQRARVKAINKAVRSGAGWQERLDPPLTEKEKRDLVNAARFAPGGTNGGYPSYHLTNLSGNINRQKKRLERLRREAGGEAR